MYSILLPACASCTCVASSLLTLSCTAGWCRSPSQLLPPHRASGYLLSVRAGRQGLPGEWLFRKIGYSYVHCSFSVFLQLYFLYLLQNRGPIMEINKLFWIVGNSARPINRWWARSIGHHRH